MSKRSWIAVLLALGGGILLQIPSWGGHAEHHAGDGHDHAAGVEMGEAGMAAHEDGAVPGTISVRLEVTGMT